MVGSNNKKINSGDIYEIAKLLASFSSSTRKRSLTFAESRIYNKALELMVMEISHSLDEDGISVKKQIEEILNEPSNNISRGNRQKILET